MITCNTENLFIGPFLSPLPWIVYSYLSNINILIFLLISIFSLHILNSDLCLKTYCKYFLNFVAHILILLIWSFLYSFLKRRLSDLTLKVKGKVTQSCLTLCDPMNCTVHGILQARILVWVAYPFCRGSYQPRNQTGVCCRFNFGFLKFLFCLGRSTSTLLYKYFSVFPSNNFDYFVFSFL